MAKRESKAEKEPGPEPEVKPEEETGEQERDVPQSCINCGQDERRVEQTSAGWRCPVCGHEWTDEHEQAPFRRIWRGEGT